MYTFDENLISDLHKDAYGFRPDQSYWNLFAAANPDQKQAIWDNLLKDLNRSIEQDQKEEQEAIAKFENRIDNLIHDVTNRKAIVAWLLKEADGDEEHFEFLNNLPFGYLKRMSYV